MDYQATKDYLFGLKGGGARYGIDRMRLLVERMGHPQRQLKVIHVAGTNGKGSVCAMCESIARAAGYRTGLYTSPHLVRLGERVQVDRKILTEAEIVAYTEELRELGREIVTVGSPEDHPTFFEFMTAMAFLHFVRRKVDVAVIEVGMGGRLDATNVVEPMISAITSIGLDHCEQLGHTFAAIAGEKAGIIKSGKPVVMGLLPVEAEEVVRRVAAERNAPLHVVAERFGPDRAVWPSTVLSGEHQVANAATAALIYEVLGESLPVSPEDIRTGLHAVEWAGRWEEKQVSGRRMIFEAAHNPEGAEVLDRQLAALVSGTGKKPVVAVGALGEARGRALLEVVARYASRIHLFMPGQSRATPFEVLESFIPMGFQGGTERSRVAEAFGPGECRLGQPGETVVVTGSIYLIGEILERLEESRPVGEGRLQD